MSAPYWCFQRERSVAVCQSGCARNLCPILVRPAISRSAATGDRSAPLPGSPRKLWITRNYLFCKTFLGPPRVNGETGPAPSPAYLAHKVPRVVGGSRKPSESPRTGGGILMRERNAATGGVGFDVIFVADRRRVVLVQPNAR